MKTIGITGGTGFIGQHLTALLVSKGYRVVIFTRSVSKNPSEQVSYAHWAPNKGECDINGLKELDGIVHLAGAGVAEKRLTEKRKREVTESRVKGTEFLLTQLKTHSPSCKTIVAASATGFYGPDMGGGPFTEVSLSYNDFLGSTCMQWETATQKANSFLRTSIIRIGIVLGKEGGAYPQFVGPLSFGIMPILGSGRQMVSWIEVDDLARLFLFALENEQMSGVYNGVAPEPVSHSELMRAIAKIKGGISIPIPVPAILLKIALGEMSTEVLKSCTVSAQKTLSSGFAFDHPQLGGALKKLKGQSNVQVQ